MSTKKLTWLSVGLTAALTFGATGCSILPGNDSNGTVVKVVDGDTVDIRIAGEDTRVRLLNIDTPETVDPNKSVECMGPEASEHLKSLLAPGDKVDLEYDIERTDKYGRTLAGVYKDKSLVNADIAAAGLGIAVKYEPNVRFYDEVLQAQNEAAAKATGLFDPSAACTIPAQLEEATQAFEQLGEAPAESVKEAESLAGEAAAAIALGHGAKSALSKITPDMHPVTYALLTTHFKKHISKLDSSVLHANQVEQAHLDTKTALIKAEEKRKDEERKKKEAAKKKAAEAKRQAQLKQQREVAEQKAAERRRIEQQSKPRQKVPTYQAPKVQKPRTQAPKPRTQSVPRNYTGPRCYAPGGKSWKPCP
ncbi:thermonuclease family protein [Glutamicibacter sp. BW77]|uniref:thermonuclease family protein n=2 Tax=Micrococcaceae TaxID=1268 RepID=UPI000BB6B000|nr:thermonuclease family protein [Glutamicibacter sp. BW77]PCC36288.1 hypothetical protein CIK74_06705 [Glutamicibacter sp. BW77]